MPEYTAENLEVHSIKFNTLTKRTALVPVKPLKGEWGKLTEERGWFQEKAEVFTTVPVPMYVDKTETFQLNYKKKEPIITLFSGVGNYFKCRVTYIGNPKFQGIHCDLIKKE